MKLGINLPQFGSHASPQAITRVAQGAERLGCEGLWVQERLLRPVRPRQPYGGMMIPWPEAYRVVFDPIEALTYAAAVTQRIKLGTSVIDALFHTPVVLGRRLASLDQLSRGRLVVGLGQGWSDDEFEVAGVPPTRKGAGFDEFLRALLAVWGPDPVRFDGRFYRIPESEIGPKPVQQPHPPLLLGGYAPAAIARAGRLGTGFNPVLASFDALSQGMDAFRSAAQAAGHAAEHLPVIVRGTLVVGERVRDEDRRPLSGSLDQAQEDVRRLASMGVDQLFVDFYLAPAIAPDEQLRLVEALLPAAD
jgi:probable F420-dependent oxidoreductase